MKVAIIQKKAVYEIVITRRYVKVIIARSRFNPHSNSTVLLGPDSKL